MSKPLQGALFVEGKGEQEAAPRLLKALWKHLGLAPFVEWTVLKQDTNFKNPDLLAVQAQRLELRNGRFQALMVIYDADHKESGQLMCPRDHGPISAGVLRKANLPIPSAVVLAWKEYEHWILASMPRWAGQKVIDPRTRLELTTVLATATTAHNDLHHRDGKHPIGSRLTVGSYRPTEHQSALTSMLDFSYLQTPEVDAVCPSFGTLCRAAQFLAAILQQPSASHAAQVYPPAPTTP
jgi:hypothetical protein